MKTKLSVKLLQKMMDFITKSENVVHSRNITALLVLMFETQSELLTLSEKAFKKIIESEQIVANLQQMKVEGKSIAKFLNALVSKLLESLQQKNEDQTACKHICKLLLTEVQFDNEEVYEVIK
jgi:hypothetical protein